MGNDISPRMKQAHGKSKKKVDTVGCKKGGGRLGQKTDRIKVCVLLKNSANSGDY